MRCCTRSVPATSRSCWCSTRSTASRARSRASIAPGEARSAVWLSARDGLGLGLLRDALGERLGLRRVVGEVHLPTDAGRLRARLHALDAVRGEHHDADGWRLSIDLPQADAARLAAQSDGAPLRALLPEAPEFPDEPHPADRFSVESGT